MLLIHCKNGISIICLFIYSSYIQISRGFLRETSQFVHYSTIPYILHFLHSSETPKLWSMFYYPWEVVFHFFWFISNFVIYLFCAQRYSSLTFKNPLGSGMAISEVIQYANVCSEIFHHVNFFRKGGQSKTLC